MPHAGVAVDGLEQALGRVQEAMDRVVAAWDAEHPDLPVHAHKTRPPAWHPDPNQDPVTTRQRAEVTRLRAEHLCRQGLQAYEQAKQVHQATQELLAFLHRPPEDRDPGEFIRVSPTILVPAPPRQRW
jgi:hypothetical protein